jgi:hypothetical protein
LSIRIVSLNCLISVAYTRLTSKWHNVWAENTINIAFVMRHENKRLRKAIVDETLERGKLGLERARQKEGYPPARKRLTHKRRNAGRIATDLNTKAPLGVNFEVFCASISRSEYQLSHCL